MTRSGRAVLPVFLFSAFVMDICILIVRPTFPLLADSLGASPLIVGMIAATMSMVYSFTALGFGRISDLIGRRPIVLGSFVVFAAGSLLVAGSKSVANLFLTISVVGIGMAMFWPIVEAWIADSAGDQQDDAMRKYCLSWSTGTMVGPVIAGGLLGSSMRFGLALSVASLLSIVSLAVVLLSGAREGRLGTANEPTAGSPSASGAPAGLFYLSLVALLSIWMAQTTTYTFFPLISSQAGISPQVMGILLFFLGAGRTLSFLLLARQPRPATTYIIILSSLLVASLSCSVFMLTSSPVLFGVALLLFGLAVGAVYVTGLRLAVGATSGRGLRAGLFESVIGIGALISPIGSGWLADIRLEWAYLFNLVALLAALGITACLRRRIQET